ncbi:MAG: 4a-hydroxytetrahydrobiopterin dehydratase [Candidatus Doudnabacteria bacterium RIFCSPLOWO2_02_FULL_42_9]|uniref:Putative pterin-4-alpha-carbinolamine dehydratase n=1 Tax=Candidatus Doudnabacteria bacterium RIFCSPHIGHO2_01_FULL_41_86 TaxID=1817821 RepID=A0A1F5N896_9BACT|nr:MAG: 4a-hydroxytetrahydrobiopterin dehydratase [Candidatus Doudnabacteria bacterium RIFCSPHIGHO2_01_FULL_41_86]OGE75886.1 MAG: 4a-hydroxytetrahydrobiopterin dehydratase [Candidatus Doudnabacteria bacterium RIFCSPHIGHO2_01_43_10]OGE86260.1 MAG: 4a-hydroxytetrahydrobiopterin dehydratase [Candidatus Doudnabacteria bacterium RIFCSPHIGHO2_12_FULL_42_22]OGE87108.1 MAG: 4a-hydroxytetrahydrobiopterin dehydratase [Candidatus Doudnabacteria bacterium RIFCSPHIGHO2_02_FULL_42_25]OGE92248.1 MAG: 4a-hydro
MKLADKKCVPCEGGIPPFSKQQVKKYLRKLNRGWKIVDNKLDKEFKFKNFVESMGFANQVALIAQAEDHHPEMEISYKKVEIELWTHAAGGLTENDFILAAKIDELQ